MGIDMNHTLPNLEPYHRQLGSTGLSVSPLGFGTVKIGRNTGVKYPKGFSLPTDSEILDLLENAKELGINLLDTAPAYGSSEQRLGGLLNNRHDWVLCSKVGEEFDQDQSFFDFTANHTRFSVERSLKRLNTDYLDLVLVHSDGNDREIIEQSDCLGTLSKLQQEGHIRAFGLSTKTVAGGCLAAELTDVVMVTYNPSQQEELVVIEEAAQRDKGVLIKKAFNSGHDLASQDSSAQTNMDFVFATKGVHSAIVGTLNKDHLVDNVSAVVRSLKK